MGGRGKSRTQRKHFREGRENVWKRSKSDTQPDDINNADGATTTTTDNSNKISRHWEPFATQNPAFDEYYKEQGIVPLEEWDSFNQVLRKPLPAAFRINSSSQFCDDIRSQLENDFMKCLQVEDVDGCEVGGIRPLSWYPENLAWHSNYSRMQLRKNQTLERFHEFLKLENEIGNLTRQEAVSMVPPLFLDVRPDHFVLDMCAAPGSKTFQLLEMIYRLAEPGSLPSGMVVANDADVQRCNLLIHQTKRMCTANLIVTNHEAQHFPSCHLNKSHSGAKNGVGVEHIVDQLQFDRVLCDVPCSGDGTLRKAPDIWRKWNAGMGNGVHNLQLLIAMRGVALLKVGGRMVYSTCSMNPVENEAVVAEILRRCGGSIELVDVSCELPQLIRRPGLKRWKVRDKGMWLASYKDVPKLRRQGIFPSMFPSGRTFTDILDNGEATEETHENGVNADSESVVEQNKDPECLSDVLDEEVSTLPLERCMRIVPHDQNTGAFFIAVFHKLAPLPVIQKAPTSSRGKVNSNNDSGPEKEQNKIYGGSSSEILQDEVIENINEVEVSLADVAEEQVEVASSDADLLGTELEEAALDSDPSKKSEDIEPKEKQNKVVGGKRKLQMQGKWRGVDPVLFFKSGAVVDGIKTFYGIDDSFPINGHLVTRNSDTDHVKRIYYVSKSVRDILELNLRGGQQLKITSIGLKMFERQASQESSLSQCAFRISSEGLPLLLPYITKQILSASLVDFKHILQYKTIKFADFVDAEFGKRASELMLGCCVVVLRKDGETSCDRPQIDASTVAIGCWRGRTNVAVMVTAIDCQELLERLAQRMETENVEPTKVDGESGSAELATLG